MNKDNLPASSVPSDIPNWSWDDLQNLLEVDEELWDENPAGIKYLGFKNGQHWFALLWEAPHDDESYDLHKVWVYMNERGLQVDYAQVRGESIVGIDRAYALLRQTKI